MFFIMIGRTKKVHRDWRTTGDEHDVAADDFELERTH